MSQLTITLDDDLLAAARAHAHRMGWSLDELIAEVIRNKIQAKAAELEASKARFLPEVRAVIGSLRLPEDFDYKTELGNALDERFGQ